MRKKYRVVSKFRFITSLTIIFLVIMMAIGAVLGLHVANSASMTQYNQVHVNTGDTLWCIAAEYAPDDMDVRKVVSDICDINEITPDQLVAGQIIVVPVYK